MESRGAAGEMENSSGDSGVQGVFPQVDAANTMPTMDVCLDLVFAVGGTA